MSDAAEPEIVSLQIVDKDGKIVRTVDDVKATRPDTGAVTFVVQTKSLKTEKLEAGQRIVDAKGDAWTIEKAVKVGQGERWNVTARKKP